MDKKTRLAILQGQASTLIALHILIISSPFVWWWVKVWSVIGFCIAQFMWFASQYLGRKIKKEEEAKELEEAIERGNAILEAQRKAKEQKEKGE